MRLQLRILEIFIFLAITIFVVTQNDLSRDLSHQRRVSCKQLNKCAISLFSGFLTMKLPGRGNGYVRLKIYEGTLFHERRRRKFNNISYEPWTLFHEI